MTVSDDQGDPSQKLISLWTEAARGYTDAMQSFWEQASKAQQQQAEQAAADPEETARQLSEQWQAGLAQLSSMQAGFVEAILTNLPAAAAERVDAQTFSQLRRLAETRWEEELRRLSEVSATSARGAQQADPAHLARLWEEMCAEYLRDLEAMPDDVFVVDLQPLAEAWGKVLTGQDDADARKVVDRFLDSMVVKAQRGGEYYADPEATAVGQTPRELVHEDGRFQLFRYALPEGAEVTNPAPEGTPPVLIVYSVINKPYILDLVPGYSFVEHLLQQGHDVYLVEWGEAVPGDRETTLDRYIDPGIKGCVEAIRERTGAEQVSLFGHCIGGNLALLYAARYPDDVARVITLTTPMTSAAGGVVALWTDEALFPVDAVVDAYGLMPAKLIRYTFMAIKPYYEVMKWKMFLENLGNDQVMALFYPVDRWANENVDIPGEFFRKFVREVFHDDRFRKGETRIHGEIADPQNITCPVMNLTAERDWIVPSPSGDIPDGMLGSGDVRHEVIAGAHVGIMVDPRTRPVWTTMSDFLAEGAGE